MGLGTPPPPIQKLHAIRMNAAILGIPIPIIFGQNRLTGKLIWYSDFQSHKAKNAGGKGLGKGGTQYVYTASVIAALCFGPVTKLLSVWSTAQGRFLVERTQEMYTVVPPYKYAPTFAGAYAFDENPTLAAAYSYTVNDYGSPGSTVLSGTTQAGMTQQPYGTSLNTGEYSIDPSNNYYFSSADAGKAVTVNYSFYRYRLVAEELDVVPFSGPYTVTVQQSATFLVDYGVQYYPAGTAFVKVSGTPTVGQYKYNGSGQYQFAAADAGQGIVISYEYKDVNTDNNAPTQINITLVGGAQSQSPWSYLTSNHPSQALGYTQLAYIASSKMYLGYTAELPNYTYEVAGGYPFGGGIPDANPADCIKAVLDSDAYGLDFPSSALPGNSSTYGLGSASLLRASCTANNFFISPIIENQDSAASVIGQWLEAAMVGAYFSEGLLKFVPYCDTSAVANNVLYQPPTQPVAAFTDDDYLTEGAEDAMKISRTPWMDAYNRVQVAYAARVNDYNREAIYEQDEGSVHRYGLRVEEPRTYDFITTLTAAQYAASVRLQRLVYIRNTYEFRVAARNAQVEPMDVVTVTNTQLGLSNTPVRVQKVEDDPVRGLTLTCEDFIWGAAAPAYNPKDLNTPAVNEAATEDPGNVNAIVFEAPDELGKWAGNIIYGFVSGQNANWGGCHVWYSYDGTAFTQLPDKNGNPLTIYAPAPTGLLNANLASYGGANPDTTNTLTVVMDANGTLTSASSAAAAQGVSLCAVVSAGGAEFLSYKTATLAGSQLYNLTTLYRGLYGSTAAAHVTGDLFVRFDEANFTFQYSQAYVGKTIYLKFTSFNLLGLNEQSLANVSAFSFSLVGIGQGAIALDTGALKSQAPGYSAYRPLSSTLSAVDAGSNATINIGSFQMRIAGAASDPTYNSGSITGLSYSTLYYVYFDQSPPYGGTVTYQASTTKETAINGLHRFFVGSIVTPAATGSNTGGNLDGGAGAQVGNMGRIFFSTLIQTAVSQGGFTTLPQLANDGDDSTSCTGATNALGSTVRGSVAALEVSLPPTAIFAFQSAKLNIKWGSPSNSGNPANGSGTGVSATYNLGDGGGDHTVWATTSGVTMATRTDTVTLNAPINLSRISVKMSATNLANPPGDCSFEFFEAWLEVTV